MELIEDMDLDLHIEAGKTTPNISFRNGELNIVGRSVPHNHEQIFDNLLKFFYLYSLTPKDSTVININLDYMNSETNRSLMLVMIIAERIRRNGHMVEINWHVESTDDTMIEHGKMFEALVEIPFKYIVN